MHDRTDGGSQENMYNHMLYYSIIIDCLNVSLLWLTNFHNLVNPHTTIKDSGLCHFKDMDKTILIFKDINCFGLIVYGFVCRFFVRILKFASHCRCTKLSVQSGDAKLQSEIVAKLVPGSGGTQLAIFHRGQGRAAAAAHWAGNSQSSFTRARAALHSAPCGVASVGHNLRFHCGIWNCWGQNLF